MLRSKIFSNRDSNPPEKKLWTSEIPLANLGKGCSEALLGDAFIDFLFTCPFLDIFLERFSCTRYREDTV